MADVGFSLGTTILEWPAPTSAGLRFGGLTQDLRRGTKAYTGTIKRAGVGEEARVFLLDRQGLTVIDETISDAAGNWAMPGKWDADKKCLELVLDRTDATGGVVEDNQ